MSLNFVSTHPYEPWLSVVESSQRGSGADVPVARGLRPSQLLRRHSRTDLSTGRSELIPACLFQLVKRSCRQRDVSSYRAFPSSWVIKIVSDVSRPLCPANCVLHLLNHTFHMSIKQVVFIFLSVSPDECVVDSTTLK